MLKTLIQMWVLCKWCGGWVRGIIALDFFSLFFFPLLPLDNLVFVFDALMFV